MYIRTLPKAYKQTVNCKNCADKDYFIFAGTVGFIPCQRAEWIIVYNNDIYPVVKYLFPDRLLLSIPFTQTLIVIKVLSSLHLASIEKPSCEKSSFPNSNVVS